MYLQSDEALSKDTVLMAYRWQVANAEAVVRFLKALNVFSLLTGEGEECEASMQVVGQFFKEKGWGVGGQDGLGE